MRTDIAVIYIEKFSKLILAALLLSKLANAQILDPRSASKRKATDRANSRIDQSIDKGLDRAEEGISNLFKKKDKGVSFWRYCFYVIHSKTPSCGATNIFKFVSLR